MIKSIYYSIKEGIQNLIKWFPLIWSDRDFDHLYIYKLLHFKLKNMEEFFNSDYAWSAKAKDVANEIKIAKLICERIVNGNYLENDMIPYHKKYDGENFMRLLPCNDGTGNYYAKFTENEKEMKLYRQCSKHSDYMEKQDKEFLWNYIKKHSDKWWD